MKIIGFEADGGMRLGAVEHERVIDLQAVEARLPTDLGAVLTQTGGDLAPLADLVRRAPASTHRPLEAITYALPVNRPGKILCLGLNYLEHAKEGGHQKPQFPSIFLRCRSSLTPHEGPIVRPKVSETLDYEAELLVIIGKRGRHMSVRNALSLVAGYACFNDGSVRQFQRRTTQWDMGKNFDATGGFGPWMVTTDELTDVTKQTLITRLNGVEVQKAPISDLVFDVQALIAYCSTFTELAPGDVIVTGTTGGVGAYRTPPLWMKGGDTVEIEISGIGILRNPVKDERRAA